MVVNSRTAQATRNFEAFMLIKERLEYEHMGQTVVMVDGEIKGFYDTRRDALKDGLSRFGYGKYSVQTIGSSPISLGIYNALV